MSGQHGVAGSLRPGAGRYTGPAIALHWLLALALVGLFGMGLYMTGLPFSPQRLKLYNWHKWAGMTVLALSLLRLLWRLSHRPPALPSRIRDAMPAWQRMAHVGTQHAMYLLFFVVPLVGWIYSSAAGFPVVWFGVWRLPDLVGVDREFAEALKPWHAWLAYSLATLVVLHTLAALQHHFIRRDGLLQRMGIGRAPPPA